MTVVKLFDNEIKSDSADKNTIAVVIFCYNQSNLIQQSICSVVNELCCGDELIIIDDCSYDATVACAKNLTENLSTNFLIKLYTKTTNKGVNDTFNLIPTLTQKNHIISLAGDDFFYPGAIGLIKKIINEAQNYSAMYSACNVVGMDGEIIGCTDFGVNFKPYSICELSAFGSSNIPGHSIACWNTDVIKIFGPFSSLVSNEDDQMLLRCTLLGNIKIIDERVRAYRKSVGSMSSPWTNFDQSVEDYLSGLVKPLKNRLNNYKIGIDTLEKYNISGSNHAVDKSKIKKNLISAFMCLETTILLLENPSFFSRIKILFRYFCECGYSSSIYFKQNIVIAISRRLFYELKRFKYYKKYSN